MHRTALSVCLLALIVLLSAPPLLAQGGNTMVSTGTGFIVDARGYVLTNEHVVNLARRVQVRFQDDTMVNAQVLSVDAQRDLALLKIDTTRHLTALPIGNSANIQRQDEVLAIGFPFGEGAVTSTGGRIVSIRTEGAEQLLVSDAVVNPGNSGGPMLNVRGEVIGVIKSILLANIGGNMMKAGEAYAIPVTFTLPMLAAIPGFDWSAVGSRQTPMSMQQVDAASSPSVVQIIADRAPGASRAEGNEPDDEAFRADATQLVSNYLDRMELKYQVVGQGQAPLFSVPFQMDNTTHDLGIIIDAEHEVVHMFLNQFLSVPEDHPRFAQIMRELMALNWRLNVGKFEWDPSDGEVRYSFVFTTENGIGYEAFMAILVTLLNTGDSLWPTLQELVGGGDAVG